MKEVIVIGAGSRGCGYARIMKDMGEDFRVVAVAEPVERKRNYIRDLFDVPEELCYPSWEELMARPRFADLVIVATMDRDHFAPAMAAIEKGYNLLLEKPMGATPEECCAIERAAAEKGVLVLVCHVLRFTAFFRAVKNLIDGGLIGDVVHIQHAEDVGNVHQSHSFVRGNWHNSERATPMIVQKTCHDMDILQWLVGKNCTRVHSFGGLSYFNAEHAPEGAPERCVEGCPAAQTCFYNAEKIYMKDYRERSFARSAAGTAERPTDEQLENVLRNTDYGRCVFRMDNDVVDHQTVNLEFEGGVTASFSMCAFTKGGRHIRIMGTKGELSGDMKDTLRFYDFATAETREIPLSDAVANDTIDGGHGGGDQGIIRALRDRLNGDTDNIAICTIEETCRNHLIAYAAEESRRSGRVMDMREYESALGGML